MSELISLFLATLLLMALSCIFNVCRCLFLINEPVTCSVHFSVNLLLDTTKREIYVSFKALQIFRIPSSVILLLLRSRLLTPSFAYCLNNWAICQLWLSFSPFPESSISPISHWSLNDSAKLNCFPFGPDGPPDVVLFVWAALPFFNSSYLFDCLDSPRQLCLLILKFVLAIYSSSPSLLSLVRLTDVLSRFLELSRVNGFFIGMMLKRPWTVFGFKLFYFVSYCCFY